MPEPPPIPWVNTAGQLETLCERLRSSGQFAFDTEFVSEQSFEPVLCLIQVATRDYVAVADPLAIRDLGPFWDVVLDPAVEVVMHAAGEDLRIARQHTGKVPERVFDVQLAAGLVGFGYPLSLGNLLGRTLGVSVFGGETRTDWRKRPLTPAQLRYAADDVRHLLDVADDIRGRLKARGRESWAESELDNFLDGIRNRNEEDRWRRLPGIQQVSRRGLEAARRLAAWRAEDARRANRPLRHLLKDDLLVAIAKRMPASKRDLEALRDFQRPALLGRSGEILDLIAEAQAVAPEDLPLPSERPDDAPGGSMLTSLLSAALNQCCARHEVAPGLVGTTADLRELISWQVQGRPEARQPALLRGWRAEVCGHTLLDVVSGRRSLRVVDPLAEVPVALDEASDEHRSGATS